MTTNTQLEQLENAILKRAQTLADAQLHDAQQQCEQIQQEFNQRLQRREEHEINLAKAVAEKIYRRHVQANEIKMHSELDQLRWSLVQMIMTQLKHRLQQLREKPESYLALLRQYFMSAVVALERDHIVVEVNAQDYELLVAQWETLISECIPNKKCNLTINKKASIGGLLIRDEGNRIQIDNTFEGLISRLETELYQVITAQLFVYAGN